MSVEHNSFWLRRQTTSWRKTWPGQLCGASTWTTSRTSVAGKRFRFWKPSTLVSVWCLPLPFCPRGWVTVQRPKSRSLLRPQLWPQRTLQVNFLSFDIQHPQFLIEKMIMILRRWSWGLSRAYGQPAFEQSIPTRTTLLSSFPSGIISRFFSTQLWHLHLVVDTEPYLFKIIKNICIYGTLQCTCRNS